MNVKRIKSKPLELFSGTGGVGKTTLSCARAAYLSSQGQKVLLITIDPAKRLKQILNLFDEDAGTIHQITSAQIPYLKDHQFDALLMSPEKTMKKILRSDHVSSTLQERFENIILKTLLRPYGGMNEIMSIVEVQLQLQSHQYDSIILDTPPGKNFLDFLESGSRINRFFDKTYIEVFKYLYDRKESKTSGPIKAIFATGIQKLLQLLERVTGKSFIEQFIQAIASVYECKDYFLRAVQFEKTLQEQDLTNWFIVTSTEQQKIQNALDLHSKSLPFGAQNSYLLINKCLDLKNWQPKTQSNQEFKKYLIQREEAIKPFGVSSFLNIFEFHEILSPSPVIHVTELAVMWGSLDSSSP